jgi:tripartite-type tricarboxylate transporter receptor subunit TctC
LLLAAGSIPASPQPAWPAHPIRFIVAAPPGSSLDVIARTIADGLHARLGQPLIVDNRAGAGGTLAAEAVARAAPDGYTMLLGFNGPLAFAPFLYSKLDYDPARDFAPVILTSSQPNLLAVTRELPVNNVAELIAYARAQPGKLNYASVGNGSSSHLTMELLKQQAGVDIMHAPYNGAPPAVLAVAGGDAQILFAVPTAMLPQLAGGKLKAIAVTSAKRFSLMPELPTLAESGFAHFESVAWNGIMLPTGTPRPIVLRLNREINAILGEAGTRERLRMAGLEPAGGTPESFAELVRTESTKWAPVIRMTGAKIE